MNVVLVLLALVAGAGLPLQAGVNAALREHVGRPEWAALLSFAVGLAGLAAWCAALRLPPPTLGAAARAPWWTWTGGLVGAFYVSALVVLTPRIGVATALALSVAGQMAAALAIDHLGLLGVATRHVSAGRILGAALLVAGVVLIRR